jgi:hypothetical protein
MNKELIKEMLDEIEYIMPVQMIYAVVGNPEYDPDNFSQEIESRYGKETTGDFFSEHPIGKTRNTSLFEDTVDAEENPLWKEWRLNHNKKFSKMAVSVLVLPKKNDDGAYSLTDSEIERVEEELKQYGEVYQITTRIDIDFV